MVLMSLIQNERINTLVYEYLTMTNKVRKMAELVHDRYRKLDDNIREKLSREEALRKKAEAEGDEEAKEGEGETAAEDTNAPGEEGDASDGDDDSDFENEQDDGRFLHF